MDFFFFFVCIDQSFFSAGYDLRLICFEASKGPSGSGGFGNSVAPAHAFKFSFAYDFYGDSDFAVVGSFRRAAEIKIVISQNKNVNIKM